MFYHTSLKHFLLAGQFFFLPLLLSIRYHPKNGDENPSHHANHCHHANAAYPQCFLRRATTSCLLYQRQAQEFSETQHLAPAFCSGEGGPNQLNVAEKCLRKERLNSMINQNCLGTNLAFIESELGKTMLKALCQQA